MISNADFDADFEVEAEPNKWSCTFLRFSILKTITNDMSFCKYKEGGGKIVNERDLKDRRQTALI